MVSPTVLTISQPSSVRILRAVRGERPAWAASWAGVGAGEEKGAASASKGREMRA